MRAHQALALVTLLIVASPVGGQELAGPAVTLTAGRVSVSARQTPLQEILAEIGRLGGIRISADGPASQIVGERITTGFERVTVEEALARLLRDKNYLLIYSARGLAEIRIFTKPTPNIGQAIPNVSPLAESPALASTNPNAEGRSNPFTRMSRFGSPQATVAPPSQPEVATAAAVPLPQPKLSETTVISPGQPEGPQVTGFPPRQPARSERTVISPGQPEGPQVTGFLPRQAELSPSTVAPPSQPAVGNKTADPPAPRAASVPESNPRPPRPPANGVDPPREPGSPPSGTEPPLQRFLRSLSPADLGGKE